MAKTKATFRRRRLAARLRALRGERQGQDVAREVGWSPTKLSKIENAIVAASTRDVQKLLRYYEPSEPQRGELMRLARHALSVGWWHDYGDVLPDDFGSFAELEQDASVISDYAQTLVPGILQTAEYALELMQAGLPENSDEEIERRLEARTSRREIFDSEHPPRMTFVIDETVLRRPVGGPRTMAEQLRALVEAAKRPNVAVYVIQMGAGTHAASGMPFTIFEFDDTATVVYAEQLASSVYVERPELTDRYMLAYKIARSLALSQTDSVACIEQVIKEL